ncbi:hypothetical protein [Vreelandella sp. GE22]
MLKPVDHQNIVLRLLTRMSPAAPERLLTLAQSQKLPLTLHQVRVACDALVDLQFAARSGDRYRLSDDGARETLAVPLLVSYRLEPSGSDV